MGFTSAYLLPQRATKYIFIYLNFDNLKPEVKNGTPGHAVLNQIQWFILVIFKGDITKNEMLELGDQLMSNHKDHKFIFN